MNVPLADDFPATPEEFYFRFGLSNSITRASMVKWFKEMLHVFVKLDDPNRVILSQYSTTLDTSLESTSFLYKIQIADNMKNNLPPKITADDKVYSKLLRSHQLWNQLEAKIQFQISQVTNIPPQYELLFGFLRNPNSNIANNIMRSFATSENILIILNDMQDNLSDMFIDIDEYKASENLD